MEAGAKHDEQRQIIVTLIGQKSLPPLFPAIAKEFHGEIELTASGGGEWQMYLKSSRIQYGTLCIALPWVKITVQGLWCLKIYEDSVDFDAGLFSLPIQKRYRDAKQASERLFDLVQQEFKTRVPTTAPATDLIGVHVNHAARFNVEPNMKGRVIDIYGSLDTTKSFSMMMFELLVERPELLERIYKEEFLPNLGNEGLLHESASFELISNKMPLVCAVLNEVLRFSNITPYIMRVAKRNLELGNNQYIPQGAYVLSNNF